jgi:glycine cleavage system H lipoate-binding protein
MKPSSLNKPETPEQPFCIWMQAGVVRHKWCNAGFQCESCRFDKKMQAVAWENKKLTASGRTPSGNKARIVFWKDKLKELPAWKRPCLHHMKNRIEFRACTNDYQCRSCEFDQYFQDQYTVHAVVQPVAVLDVHGFRIPQGYYLHPGHTWVKIEDNSEVRIGIDDFAMRVLGPLDNITAPLIGKELRQENRDISLKRGAREAKLLSPVSGVITAMNMDAVQQREGNNSDPYTDGWVARIHAPDLRRELRQLMIGAEAEHFLNREVDDLYQVIEEEAGPLAADGGLLGSNIYGNLPENSWNRLTKRFLHTG